MPKRKSFPSAGRRLLAALISYQAGHAGVDRLLKQYESIEISPGWDELAMKLLEQLNARRGGAAPRIPEPPKWTM